MLKPESSNFWGASRKLDRIVDELSRTVEEHKDAIAEAGVSHVNWAIFQLRLASEEFFKLSSARRRKYHASKETDTTT